MQSPAPSPAAGATAWSGLSFDLVEFILSLLPLRSAIVAGAVCKQWRAAVSHQSFPSRAAVARRRRPWLFIYGHNNVVAHKNQTFGFDPDDAQWAALPPPSSTAAVFGGAAGLFFATTAASHLCHAPLLRGQWRRTSPLSSPRVAPLVGVFGGDAEGPRRFVIVGGSRFIGGLVDIEDRFAVEIYDPWTDSWELCSPLPSNFHSGGSSQWLTAALVACRRLFFVFGIYSGDIAVFDLGLKAWTCGVRTLRPPGVLFSFLLPCSGDLLVLAGVLAGTSASPPCLILWIVDSVTLEYHKISAMPRELLCTLFDSSFDEDESKFASLKCVGIDGIVYAFNEDHHKAYPACMCEIGLDFRCRWFKVPPLPCAANPFHKVVAFCSPVSFKDVLGDSKEQNRG